MTSNNDPEVLAFDASNSCPIKVVFDTFTPRPHFILIQKDKQREATSVEIQAGLQLISQFLTASKEYDGNAILSFHRGSWYQQKTNHFHAHLCVPLEPYQRAASKSGNAQGKCTRRQSRVLNGNGATSASNESLVGYIHLDPTDYMKWLPPQIRSQWVAEFEQIDFKVLT
ncbi:unnamed protein product [Rotaria sp. Silwood2]|nr:unnamed protein product [Rotaria sp. Silwood2]CAF2970342.1 unnamed protein product [Rotaria sp. Silwood2]CAF3249727.1 unnamed protein product [Rotaria sp. Silwood2]CAF3343134.1 unnamed protein product [Rotaria sp. Silwood2]CAF4449043.1 unnamed protein product [Rotaria sp. Silwood2]